MMAQHKANLASTKGKPTSWETTWQVQGVPTADRISGGTTEQYRVENNFHAEVSKHVRGRRGNTIWSHQTDRTNNR